MARPSTSRCTSDPMELALWAISVGASSWIIDAEPFVTVRVAGVVERLTIEPRRRIFRIAMSDGTGTIRAEWPLLEEALPLKVGIGSAVILEGLVLPTSSGPLLDAPAFALEVSPRPTRFDE